MRFVIRGIPQDIADEVRRTRRSPGYGHPAHEELAAGTGPCRCCLRTFVPGRDRRLLFTWRPRSPEGSLMAPGPVFIHADHCEAYAADGFPELPSCRIGLVRNPHERSPLADALAEHVISSLDNMSEAARAAE